MSLNLQQLTTFCAVLNEGSMTAAAQKLFLTQPAISQQIRHLEEQVGVELLVRGVRNVRPTLQGQMLYDYAKRIIELTQQAQLAIQTVRQDVSGYLRVGTLNSIGMAVMSPLVGLFLKNNSSLRLHLNYGSVAETVRGFEQGEIDVMILPELESEYEIEAPPADKKFLFKDEIALVGSGRDPQMPRQIDVSELSIRPLVSFEGALPAFDRALSQSLGNLAKPQPVFSTNNIGTLKRVVESGLGWGFLPLHSVKKQARTGRLTLVSVKGFQYSTNITLYSAQRAELRPAIDVLYRAIQQSGVQYS